MVRITQYNAIDVCVCVFRALFMEPTLLMLDEPTNHLDLNAVIWLNRSVDRESDEDPYYTHTHTQLSSVMEEDTANCIS